MPVTDRPNVIFGGMKDTISLYPVGTIRSMRISSSQVIFEGYLLDSNMVCFSA